MTDEEFHKLVDDLIKGCPPAIAVARMASALKVAVEHGGTDSAKAVREHVIEVNKQLKEFGMK